VKCNSEYSVYFGLLYIPVFVFVFVFLFLFFVSLFSLLFVDLFYFVFFAVCEFISYYLDLLCVSTCLLVHRCSSKVGRHYAQPGKQAISIGDGCNNVGTIIHELMHTVGKNTIELIIDYYSWEITTMKHEVKTALLE